MCNHHSAALMKSIIEPAAASIHIKKAVYQRAELDAVYLPVHQMLQIDRVCEIDGSRLICEMDLDEHWVFPMHFPSDPIFPGSLLIEAAGQAVAIWAWENGLRGKPRMVKVQATFENPVLPEDHVVILSGTVRQRKNICMGRVELTAGGKKVAEIHPVLIIVPE
jgi:3-hydroxymyristoyl/3-hydroxydecanoyl-(acyl carrier protein) dehydratase